MNVPNRMIHGIFLSWGPTPVFGRPGMSRLPPVFGKPGEFVDGVPPTSTAFPNAPVAQLSVAATCTQID